MQFYSFGDVRRVLEMPITTFWMLHKNIDRILAERDMRHVELAVHTQSPDGVKTLMESLRSQMREPFVFESAPAPRTAKLDREGLAELKAMFRRP